MIIRLAAAALSEPLGAPSVVSISDGESNGPNGYTAGIRFGSDGSYYRYRFGVPIFHSYWLTPQVNMGDYEIRATLSNRAGSGRFARECVQRPLARSTRRLAQAAMCAM